MSNNQQLLERKASKSAHTVTTIASAGRLNLKQVKELTSLIYDISGLRGNVREVLFDGRGTEITTMNFSGRAAVRDTEGVDSGVRQNVTPASVPLDGSYVKIPIDIGHIFTDQNVAEGDGPNQVKMAFANQLRNDIEELIFHGNTNGPAIIESTLLPGVSGTSSSNYVKDDYLDLMDGLIQQAFAGGTVINAAASNDLVGLVNDQFLGLPEKYRTNRESMINLISTNTGQRYRHKLHYRATDLGDQQLKTGNVPLDPFGLQMLELGNWGSTPKQVEHFTLTETGTFTLRNQNITNLVITDASLGATDAAAYILTTDYTANLTTGVITHVGGGNISAPASLKATYNAPPMMLLTPRMNIVVGFSKDMRIDEWFNPHKGVMETVLRMRVAAKFQDPNAVVLVKNILDTNASS